MSQSVLLELESNRVQAALRTVEEWRRTRDLGSDLTEDVNELVQVARQAPDAVRLLWTRIWKRARAGRIEDYQATGEDLRKFFSRLIRFVQVVAEIVNQFRDLGHEVEGADELPATLTLLRRMEEQALGGWPWHDPKDAEKALAEYAEGKCKTVEEILDELQGRHP